MTARSYKLSDFPALSAMAEAAGFPYPQLASEPMETVVVVVDDDNHVVMAVAAKRLVELYLYCGEGMAPHQSLAAIRILHDAVAEELRAKGYNEVNVFLPPPIAARFGRRLERTFQWVKNWPSWARHF